VVATRRGEPCTINPECLGHTCVDELTNGWPSGYCSGDCDPMAGACAGGGVCVDLGTAGGCYKPCIQASDCRDGYDCLNFGGQLVCYPSCTEDAQCPTTGSCNVATGFCDAG
jgi:hypothetical protein